MSLARTAMLTAVILCTSHSVLARCSTPTAPYCATRYGAFDDDDEFRRCKSEMESYKSETEDFLSCQKRESDRAIQEYNESLEAFNRRARG
jgi:hypothetical protein